MVRYICYLLTNVCTVRLINSQKTTETMSKFFSAQLTGCLKELWLRPFVLLIRAVYTKMETGME